MSEVHQDELQVSPLTTTELRWIKQLDAHLKKQPKRLLLVECADSLLVVDGDVAPTIEMHDGGAHSAGIVLYDLDYSTMKVTSVSG